MIYHDIAQQSAVPAAGKVPRNSRGLSVKVSILRATGISSDDKVIILADENLVGNQLSSWKFNKPSDLVVMLISSWNQTWRF